MDQLQAQIITALGSVVTIVATYAVSQLKAYLDKKGVTQKLKLYESSANIAVKAVEQIYQNENGPAKFELAKKRLAKDLEGKGLNVTEDDLKYFIESAVYGLKQGWKETDTSE